MGYTLKPLTLNPKPTPTCYPQVRLDVEATDKELSDLGIDTAACGAMSNLKKLAKEGGNKAVVGGYAAEAAETPGKKLTEGGAGVHDGLAVGGGGAEGAGEEGGGVLEGRWEGRALLQKEVKEEKRRKWEESMKLHHKLFSCVFSRVRDLGRV